MDAYPVVETHRYNTGSSRPVFPYEVYIPYTDEPEHLRFALMDQAAHLLNAPEIKTVFSPWTIKQIHAYIGLHVKTEMVLVLDGDLALGAGPFKMFPTEILGDEKEFVHLWHVRNPVNGLEYGHGGAKLFNTEQLALANNLEAVDMTTAFNKGMVIHTECIGTHKFNWSAESTWRTAFREVAKLTHLAAKGDGDEAEEAETRAKTWLCVADDEAEYGDYCIAGAEAGYAFAQKSDSLAQINDYTWLYAQFKQQFPNDY
jgi:hypothetical protein